MSIIYVTPRVGVWIETNCAFDINLKFIVTPRVGVWIETFNLIPHSRAFLSLPAWECGLKL